MATQAFFKPTLLYKEYMILDLIEKNKDITQRDISQAVGIAVSMVNEYIDAFVKDGLMKRKKHTSKTVEYLITKKGTERRKLLNIWYLKSSHNIYMQAKDNISKFLNQIIDKGFKKILLYGAGEVAEIILQVMNDDNQLPLEVLAVIDDDQSKAGNILVNLDIITLDKLDNYDHDGILISSYTHHIEIKKHLDDLGYPKHQILEFFQ